MLGELISAGASLIGGLFGNQQKKEGQEREIELQKEFAQNGLRWKVEDAQRAGIHPLAALGSSGAQYSPVGLGDNDSAAIGSSIGQDLSGAINATRTAPERASAIGHKMEALGLERAGLENELLRAQILDITRPRTPPFPMAGTDYNVPGQPGSGIKVAGQDVGFSPDWSNAQVAEDRYGDLVQMLYGAGVLAGDVIHNSPRGTKGTRSVFGDRSKMSDHKTGGGF